MRKGAFTVLMQQSCVTDVSTAAAAQRNVLHLKLKLNLLQYRTAVIDAATAIQALQLNATQMQ